MSRGDEYLCFNFFNFFFKHCTEEQATTMLVSEGYLKQIQVNMKKISYKTCICATSDLFQTKNSVCETKTNAKRKTQNQNNSCDSTLSLPPKALPRTEHG